MQCIIFNIIHTDDALFRLWINEYIGLHSSGPNFKLVEGKAPTSIFDAFLRYRNLGLQETKLRISFGLLQ